MHKFFAKTSFVGQNRYYLPQCQSTNDYLKTYSHVKDLPEGFLVYSLNQTKGRGQRGNKWVGESGKSLAVTVLLKPDFLDIQRLHHLYIMTSLAVCDVVQKTVQRDVAIKWPNDILITKSKVSGILIENEVNKYGIQSSLIGIGINVLNEEFIGFRNTSLALNGFKGEINTVLSILCESLELRYAQLRSNFQQLKREYLDNLYLRGEIATFETGEEQFSGEIVSVDNDGRLVLNVQNKLNTYDVKQIRYLK